MHRLQDTAAIHELRRGEIFGWRWWNVGKNHVLLAAVACKAAQRNSAATSKRSHMVLDGIEASMMKNVESIARFVFGVMSGSAGIGFVGKCGEGFRLAREFWDPRGQLELIELSIFAGSTAFPGLQIHKNDLIPCLS